MSNAVRITMLGPRGCGKTTLLAALDFVAHQQHKVGGYGIESQVGSADLRDLGKIFRRTFQSGRFHAESTNKVIQHQLHLTVTPQGERPWEAQIAGLDSPGEWTTGPEREEDRATLIEELQKSTGIVLCLPQDLPDNREGQAKRAAFSSQLSALMDNTIAAMDGRKLPWGFVAIALTKLDTRFYHYQAQAWERVLEASTLQSLETHLRSEGMVEHVISEIRGKCALPVRFAAGFCSIYGFLRRNGRVNYDPTNEQLLLRVSDRVGDQYESLVPFYYVQEQWRPFQILEPFLFAARGCLPEERRKKSELAPTFLEVFAKR